PDTPRYEGHKPSERIHEHFLLPPAAFASSLSSSTASNAGEVVSYTSPLSRNEVQTAESYRAPAVEEESSTPDGRSSSSGSYEEEIVYNVFPHSQAKPILIKRPHHKREHYSTFSTGLREFGSGSYDDKPLVRDSDDEGSPEFGRSHKDDTIPSMD